MFLAISGVITNVVIMLWVAEHLHSVAYSEKCEKFSYPYMNSNFWTRVTTSEWLDNAIITRV